MVSLWERVGALAHGRDIFCIYILAKQWQLLFSKAEKHLSHGE
jgi:hypothetical protein